MQYYRPKHIKLIFNPQAGRPQTSPNLLQDVLLELQKLNFIPEVLIVESGAHLTPALNDALKRNIRLFVVCGGDGTIEAVSRWMLGKRAVLGIIPAGTQNNLALCMGIPSELRDCASLLRTGQRSKVDIGIAKSKGVEFPFLELCSIGLFSALFDSADNLQKGNLSSLAEIFTTLTSFPHAEIQLVLDKKQVIKQEGLVVLIANLPYFGLNYRLTANTQLDDNLLDVLVFTEFSKLELVGNMLQTNSGESDQRIHRYRVHSLEVRTDPALPTLADGTSLGDTPISISVKPKALTVMTGLSTPTQPNLGFLGNLKISRFFRK